MTPVNVMAINYMLVEIITEGIGDMRCNNTNPKLYKISHTNLSPTNVKPIKPQI